MLLLKAVSTERNTEKALLLAFVRMEKRLCGSAVLFAQQAKAKATCTEDHCLASALLIDSEVHWMQAGIPTEGLFELPLKRACPSHW